MYILGATIGARYFGGIATPCFYRSSKEKETYLLWTYTMRKHDSLEKDIIIGTLSDKRTRGRSKTSWMNNITAWIGLTLNDILRKTEERSEWRVVIWRLVNPRSEGD